MKHSIKISMMALVAMFAFSTIADAQFGFKLPKLGKKKKSTVVVPVQTEQAKPQNEIKPFDASARLPEKPMARTIFTMPGTGEKMMLDYKADCEWVVETVPDGSDLSQMKCLCKDQALIKKAEELFHEKFDGKSIYYITSVNKPTEMKFKTVFGGTQTPSWQYRRDNWGEIIERFMVFTLVLECSDGENLLCRFEIKQPHAGGGNYDESASEVRWVNGGLTKTDVFAMSGWEVKTDCYTSTLAQ